MLKLLCRMLLVLPTIWWAAPVRAAADLVDAEGLSVERVAGPFVYPWSLAILPDKTMLVTEKLGRLKYARLGRRGITVGNVPRVKYGSQGGLRDVVLAPDFKRTGTIYLSYSNGGRVRITKAKFDPALSWLSGNKTIFESNSALRDAKHLGGRLAVSKSGYVFLALGDLGEASRAQDLSDHAGAILRIRTNGRVPKTNPFAKDAGAEGEIWSYGHRNPEGLALDAKTGDVWSHEHGPLGGDELNKIVKGQNYGWPIVSYGGDGSVETLEPEVITKAAKKAGIEVPLRIWTPSIATSGLAIIRKGQTISFWIGGLDSRILVRLVQRPDGTLEETRFVVDEIGRIRDVRVGPDGDLYVLTESSRGYVYRVSAGSASGR